MMGRPEIELILIDAFTALKDNMDSDEERSPLTDVHLAIDVGDKHYDTEMWLNSHCLDRCGPVWDEFVAYVAKIRAEVGV